MTSEVASSNFRTRCLDGRRRNGNPTDELHDRGSYESFGPTRPYGLAPVGESKRQTSQFWQVTPPAVLVMVVALFAALAFYGYFLVQHINIS